MAYKFYLICLISLCLTGCGTLSITTSQSKIELATTPARRIAHFISDTSNKNKFDNQEVSGDYAHVSFRSDTSRYEVVTDENILRIQIYALSATFPPVPDREIVDDAIDGTVDYGLELFPGQNGEQPKTVDQYKKHDPDSETKWQPYYQMLLYQIISKYQIDKK